MAISSSLLKISATWSTRLLLRERSTGMPPRARMRKPKGGLKSSFFPRNRARIRPPQRPRSPTTKSQLEVWGAPMRTYFLLGGGAMHSFQPKALSRKRASFCMPPGSIPGVLH
jgi:hypothetical protein